MFKSLFYLLGCAVFALILDEKLFALTGLHLTSIIKAVAGIIAAILRQAGAL